MALTHHDDDLPFPDGIGQNKLLGVSGESISLGTAALLMMGLTKRIITHTPPVVTGNGGPAVIRLQAISKPSASGHIRHAVELPMMLDASCERQYDAQEMTHADAQEHGFTSPEALRRELRIKPGEARTLYSYPVAITPTEEISIDHERYGTHLNRIQDALHDAWTNGKNGQSSKRHKAGQDGGNRDKTIQRALDYFSTQSPPAQREGLHRIAPYWAMDEPARKQWLTHKGNALLAENPDISMDTLRHHQLPSEQRVTRLLQGELEPKKERVRRDRGENVKLTEGDGWVLTVAKGPNVARQGHPDASNDAVEPTKAGKKPSLEERIARKARKAARSDLAKAEDTWAKRTMRDGLDEAGQPKGKAR
ncbi:MAG: hypothetical protein DI582_05115 [Azospirillum brasilense]|nr:MAG: hypothetical protein DI582_05115 [Azospirillum brasilense]